MEKNMETIINWLYIGVMLGLDWGYIGIMEKKMQTTILYWGMYWRFL